MAANNPHVSLIIPAFNEEARIRESLNLILSFFRSQSYRSEIIIVDDGSQDRTVDLVQKHYSKEGVRIYRQPGNMGKGEAVKRGMTLAAGKYLFFSDADLSVPIEALPVFLAELETQCDIAIGTRRRPGARIEIHQPPYREFMGAVYTKLSSWILNLKVSDVTCGFKGFRSEVARDLFPRQRLKNWSFDAEILYLARIGRYRISEIPVHWRNDERTKVKLWRDSAGSFFGLLQILFHAFRGAYRRAGITGTFGRCF